LSRALRVILPMRPKPLIAIFMFNSIIAQSYSIE
jgi:hypothetical protein